MKFLVAGDVMLDTYTSGEVKRISPEAPVPILQVTDDFHVPGGAANVALGSSALGHDVVLLGSVGQDAFAAEIERLLGNLVHLSLFHSGNTLNKHRFVSGGHQMLRVDRGMLSDTVPNAMLDNVIAEIGILDGVVISDYSKASLSVDQYQVLLAEAAKLRVPSIVDSKHPELAVFRQATIVKPNSAEVVLATGVADPVEASVVLNQTISTTVVTTLGAGGILSVENGAISLYPAVSQEVVDVTGAGDTVNVALTHSIASGKSLDFAIRLATHMAAISVSHLGTYAPTESEVEQIEAALG